MSHPTGEESIAAGAAELQRRIEESPGGWYIGGYSEHQGDIRDVIKAMVFDHHSCTRCGKSIAADPSSRVDRVRVWLWRKAHRLNCPGGAP